ncbi:ankyrin repeat domain-containing protein SOWAHC isoform X2 [Denticeps clupeoides]|uniref:ankyrin repeat domain-containing protein SOWAHC isoform X2 n=1 Tax=Denticeps clupeoides TaxID=299321 RepID=UPI0010A3E786|nr:ankyrin repeat domain-containing protein SOWAHC-like isoform X2 [Denticeps clupeoides]
MQIISLETTTTEWEILEGFRLGQNLLENKEVGKILKQDHIYQDGKIPAVVVTQADEACEPYARLCKGTEEKVKQAGTVPSSPSTALSLSDAGDLTWSDLQSLRSDSLSLASEAAVSVKSDEREGLEDDTRSVTASSITSLFHRLQLDPLEKDWLRCAALGNSAGLQQLLQQDPTLASRRDFVTGFTALHWAAKQGRAETADMIVRAGADVNVRSGYTPLHLAALHGHSHIIQLLIDNYNAKVSIRDYHGKMAIHYWTGNADVFKRPVFQSCGKWSRGRRGGRYAQLSSILLPRSKSHGHLSLELATSTGSPEHPAIGRPRTQSPC